LHKSQIDCHSITQSPDEKDKAQSCSLLQMRDSDSTSLVAASLGFSSHYSTVLF